jgi:hypothetical protein
LRFPERRTTSTEQNIDLEGSATSAKAYFLDRMMDAPSGDMRLCALGIPAHVLAPQSKMP